MKMTNLALGVSTLAVVATTFFIAFVLLPDGHTEADGFGFALSFALVSQLALGGTVFFVFQGDRKASVVWVWTLMPLLCAGWALLAFASLLVFPMIPLTALYGIHVFGGLGLVLCLAVVAMAGSHIGELDAEERATNAKFGDLERAIAHAQSALSAASLDTHVAQGVRTALNRTGSCPRGKASSSPAAFATLVEALGAMSAQLESADGTDEGIEAASKDVVRAYDALLAG